METPSSTRRVTRSQTASSAKNNKNSLALSRKIDESEIAISKSRQKSGKKPQQDRSALVDITNDSPIIGIAMGNLETPSSAMSKRMSSTRVQMARTPGSGEALLRGQVKTLLQKVEEEAVDNTVVSFNLSGLVNSPKVDLLAPTPANTPQILMNLSDKCLIPQMISEMFDEKEEEEKDMITRALVFDFSDKSERSDSDSSKCSSVLTYQGAFCKGPESSVEKISSMDDDDDASIWSIQVNASSTGDDEEEKIEEDCQEDGFSDELDELCEGMKNVSVEEEGPKFSGKHIRFVYDSDGEEIQGEQEVSEDCEDGCGEEVVRLKGLPTPKGKHVRFPDDQE